MDKHIIKVFTKSSLNLLLVSDIVLDIVLTYTFVPRLQMGSVTNKVKRSRRGTILH